jgi:hypothetical protein
MCDKNQVAQIAYGLQDTLNKVVFAISIMT